MVDRAHLQSKIMARATIEDRGYSTPCWVSDYAAHPRGYTTMYWNDRTQLTHRVAYTAFVGPIPDGLQIDHLCRVRACCNPAHLEAVTSRENTLRGVSLAARYAQQTHCQRGHPLEGWNAYARPNGKSPRTCRTCKLEATRRSDERRRLNLSAARALG